jgi:hypothetical protein
MEYMKFRTLALALALGFGLAGASEAKTKKPAVHHKAPKHKSNVRKVKTKKPKRH